jgi:hypothetical protein
MLNPTFWECFLRVGQVFTNTIDLFLNYLISSLQVVPRGEVQILCIFGRCCLPLLCSKQQSGLMWRYVMRWLLCNAWLCQIIFCVNCSRQWVVSFYTIFSFSSLHVYYSNTVWWNALRIRIWFNIELLIKMDSVYNHLVGRNTQVSCSLGGNCLPFVNRENYFISEDLSIDLSISIHFLQNSSLFLEEVDWWAYVQSNCGKPQGTHQEVLFLVFIYVFF